MLHHSPLYNKRVPPSLLVNFTNILLAAFLYKSFACSFFVLSFSVCTFLAQEYLRKSCFENVGEIDTLPSFTSLRICRVLPLVIHNASFEVHEQRKFEEWNLLEFR